jgi:plasmid stability protein
MKATSMAQLTVRNVNDQIVKALKKRAAEHGRSAEAEHREILRSVLTESEASFAERAAALRKRLRSSADSSDLIRADRDRDHAA